MTHHLASVIVWLFPLALAGEVQCSSDSSGAEACTPEQTTDPVFLLQTAVAVERSGSSIQIFVQTITGKVITLDVDSSSTIMFVKQLIQHKEGAWPWQQRLIFQGILTQDSYSIADYNIQDKSMLQLVLDLVRCAHVDLNSGSLNLLQEFDAVNSTGMPSNPSKRIEQELQDIQKKPLKDISVSVPNNNLFIWDATINGSTHSPYAGGTFHLGIEFPNIYPWKPPSVKFTTKIYHCNVNYAGAICLDILKDNWSPALTIGKVLLAISSLLAEPGCSESEAISVDVAKQYRNDRQQFEKTAREWVQKYAS